MSTRSTNSNGAWAAGHRHAPAATMAQRELHALVRAMPIAVFIEAVRASLPRGNPNDTRPTRRVSVI